MRLKEALYTFKGGVFGPSSKADEEILKRYADPELFLKEISWIYEDTDFLRFNKSHKTMKCIQCLVGLVTAVFFLGLMASIFMTGRMLSEYLYLGLCGVLILFFVALILQIYMEAKVFGVLRKKILKKVADIVSEKFTETTFYINADRSMTLRIRPMNLNEDDPMNDLENMDYYDYINYNNPEDEDYYNRQNPYELDPHEKNITEEAVLKREKELEKEAKRGKKFKLNNVKAKNQDF